MPQEACAPTPTRAFYTVKQIAERHPAFTERTLRHWIFNAKSRYAWERGRRVIIPGNGFAKVLARSGRRVYIDEAALIEWLEGGEPGGSI